MAGKAALMVVAGAVVGFIWWASRPVAAGTRVNAVAGLRG